MRHAFPLRALASFALICSAFWLSTATAAAQSHAAPSGVAKSAQAGAEAADSAGADQEQALAPPRVSPLLAHQRKTLQQSLQALERDRRGVNTLLPWLVTAAGAGMIVVAAILGVEASIGCSGTCKGASAAPAWLMIGGATLGIGGLVWVVRTGREVSQLDTREYRIKNELERLDWNAAPVPRASLSPTLSLRAAF